MHLSTLFMALGLLILLASIGYVGITYYDTQAATQKASASLAPIVRQIMVVDINQRGIFTPDMVVTGQLPVLSINQSNNPNDYSKVELNFLDHAGRLTVYDENNDNRIDLTDPVFSRLELVYINQGRISSVIPLQDAGIHAIYLDRGNLVPTELYPGGPKGYWNVNNTAILGDGSTRTVKVMGMDADLLPPS
jgi:hypothetical protein